MRVLGIDPGSVHIGWCVVDVGLGVASWVAADKLRQVYLSDGFRQIVQEYSPELVAIETPVPRAAGALRQLVDTALVAGRITGIAETYGPVVTYTSYEWRKALTGAANAKDNVIAFALSHVVDIPKRTNPHTRDACGVAIYAGRTWLATKKSEEDYRRLTPDQIATAKVKIKRRLAERRRSA